MNSNFDLNINNYNKNELEELLELPMNYDESIVEMKETKLRQNIMNDNSISSSIKSKTISFIANVKNILTTNIQKQKNNPLNNIGNGINSLTKTYQGVYNTDKTLKKSDITDVGNTYIIKQPNTSYGQSSPSEFYPGSINPLSKRILRKNINIDTRFRDNYYTSQASNFHLDLPIRLTQVVSLQLTALELPGTFYSVSKVFGNNFFVIEITGVEPLIVTMPDGNYSYLDLQNYINNYLLNASISSYNTIQFLADINTPSGTNSSGSGRMIVGSKTGTIQFSLNFQTDKYGNEDRQTPLPLKLGWMMGFREGFYDGNTN